jgi:putative two-component system response regulator
MTVREGVKLGAYEVLERIGRGGMATVYRAYHPALDREVAIKVLPEFFADSLEYRERFQHEARLVARLKHPNILEVFDFASDEGVAYIVMELVTGGTLESCIGSPMRLEDVLDILSPIAAALDYAHSRGVLHRDVKPSNILMRGDGTPVLADFGLSRLTQASHRLTEAGVVVGTAEYMSPEQAADRPLGPASDRYALAVVAYEMFTGRVPFEGTSTGALLVAHMTRAVPPTHELEGTLTAHVESVLRRGLAKDPGDRYPSAAAFVKALRPAAWLGADAAGEKNQDSFEEARPSRPRPMPVVLVVDDAPANRELLKACLGDIDCDVRTAEDGETAIHMVREAAPDLVLLDVQMPGMNGYEVCERIRELDRGRLIPVVMVTALDRSADRVRALASGADDFLTKPVDRIELVARVRSALEKKSIHDRLEGAERVIFALAAAVEAKDPYTEAHTQRVAEWSRRIGIRLGLPEDELESLYRGGIIHDIGKIGVPDHILLKPGELDVEETTRMHLHPIIGENIVAPLQTSGDLLPMIRHHHEAFDGTGYPDRLAGEAIPLHARIVSVCDAFDALTSDRPYRRKQSREQAVAVLRRGAGHQWDPRIVDLVVKEAEAMPPEMVAI